MISFYYGGKLIHNTVVNHSEGCRIAPQQPLGRGGLYSLDSMQSVPFPSAELIEYDRQRHVTRKLLGHLERGVLVRANQEGIFIKRLCQSRVFWIGLGEVGSQYNQMACKLERDAVVKIFDTGRFLHGEPSCLLNPDQCERHTFISGAWIIINEDGKLNGCSLALSVPALQLYQDGQFPAPDPTVTLCFGEELHDLSNAKGKLIIVQVRCRQWIEQHRHHFNWAKKTHRISCLLYADLKMHLFPFSLPLTDQRVALPAAAGGSEHAALSALLQQLNLGDVW